MKKYYMPATEAVTVLSCNTILSGSVTMVEGYGDPSNPSDLTEGSIQL